MTGTGLSESAKTALSTRLPASRLDFERKPVSSIPRASDLSSGSYVIFELIRRVLLIALCEPELDFFIHFGPLRHGFGPLRHLLLVSTAAGYE